MPAWGRQVKCNKKYNLICDNQFSYYNPPSGRRLFSLSDRDIVITIPMDACRFMKFLFDLLPVVLFFVAYKLDGIYVATAVLIVTSLAQVAWLWFRHGRVERMPLITALLVLLLGGATLLLHDETFVKWKPTVVNWLFALAFLGSQFIGGKTLVERMMASAIDLPAEIWNRLNSLWVAFFALMGAVNLYVAFNFTTDIWVDFKLFGMLGLTLVFVVLQSFYLARYLKKPAVETSEE